MAQNSPTNRKLSNPSPSRNQLVERCSSIRGCEPCKRRKRICNGQKPCTHCTDASQECVYSVVSDHPRSVFTTSTARRLSSGSACETCRRRKTKCDGCSPCNFCASSGIECINNSERRKRSVIASTMPSSLSNSTLPTLSSTTNTSTSSSANNSINPTTENDNEAIDRIEDRLRRIEKLMTAFTPSPLSQQTPFTKEIKDIKRVTAGFRKMSSPHLQKPTLASPRQHRHSIHGPTISPTNIKEKDTPYASPPNSNGSLKSFHETFTNYQQQQQQQQQQQHLISSPSPPLSPRILRQSSSTNVVASSMLNLSLSPSSSTSSASTVYHSYMQPSVSTPTSPLANTSSSDNALSLQNEWKQSTPIPSLMDQLSKCTFVTTAMDYTTVHYPIYPISNKESP